MIIGVVRPWPGAGHDFRRRAEFIPFSLFLHPLAIEPEVRPAGSKRNEFRSTIKDPSENVPAPWFFKRSETGESVLDRL